MNRDLSGGKEQTGKSSPRQKSEYWSEGRRPGENSHLEKVRVRGEANIILLRKRCP